MGTWLLIAMIASYRNFKNVLLCYMNPISACGSLEAAESQGKRHNCVTMTSVSFTAKELALLRGCMI